jgi:hypothetical protein
MASHKWEGRTPWIINQPKWLSLSRLENYPNTEMFSLWPKIKFCWFPLSDRPTKIAATQKNLFPYAMKNNFLKIFFHSYETWNRWMYLIALLLNIDQQTSTLVRNIEYEWSLLSAILITEGNNKIFFLPTYLPIGQIVESERGNKQYFDFDLGLI